MADTLDMVHTVTQEYRLWGETRAGNAEGFLSLLADDVKWSSLAGGSPGMEFTRDCHGKTDVVRYFQELAQDWEMLYFEVQDVISQDDRIVVHSHCGWKSKHTGKTAETPKIDLIRVRDGKITEFREFYDTAKAFAATRPD